MVRHKNLNLKQFVETYNDFFSEEIKQKVEVPRKELIYTMNYKTYKELIDEYIEKGTVTKPKYNIKELIFFGEDKNEDQNVGLIVEKLFVPNNPEEMYSSPFKEVRGEWKYILKKYKIKFEENEKNNYENNNNKYTINLDTILIKYEQDLK